MELRELLKPERGLVFRLTHIDNLRWIGVNGLHAASSGVRDPNFVSIGSADIISRRTTWPVTTPLGGALSDYVPFYFTPRSIMQYNIATGRNGVMQRSREELAVLVSSVARLRAAGRPVLISPQHAIGMGAVFVSDPEAIFDLDWSILQRCDFKRDGNDPDKLLRYHAEALAHRHVPIDALLGVACASEASAQRARGQLPHAAVWAKVRIRKDWFF